MNYLNIVCYSVLLWGDQRGRLRSCRDLNGFSGLSAGDKLVYSEGHRAFKLLRSGKSNKIFSPTFMQWSPLLSWSVQRYSFTYVFALPSDCFVVVTVTSPCFAFLSSPRKLIEYSLSPPLPVYVNNFHILHVLLIWFHFKLFYSSFHLLLIFRF